MSAKKAFMKYPDGIQILCHRIALAAKLSANPNKNEPGVSAELNEMIEVSLYSLFLKIVRDEVDYRATIGKHLIPRIQARMENAADFPIKLVIETKILKCLNVLVNNCHDNIGLVNDMRNIIDNYAANNSTNPKI